MRLFPSQLRQLLNIWQWRVAAGVVLLVAAVLVVLEMLMDLP
jgi:uncharacterized membrane protein HdeD (DUF308 family)